MKRVLSLGAGVQSSALLLMSCRGLLPRLDCAVFADTGWEPRAVYQNLVWLEDEARAAGIPVHRVSAGNLRDDLARGFPPGATGRFVTMPMHVARPDGRRGILRRQCTTEYKLRPIEKFLRRHILGLRPRQRAPRSPVIEQWLGISADEALRMKGARHPWQTLRYPLIQDMSPPMSRQDCQQWLLETYGRTVPRSSCIGCPFHTRDEWRALDTEDWQDAVSFDATIRHGRGLDGEAYLHRSLVPLDRVDLRTAEDMGQLNWLNECEGLCGV